MLQAHRDRLYADGLCRSCELPLQAARALSPREGRRGASRAVSARVPYKAQTAHGRPVGALGRPLARVRATPFDSGPARGRPR